LSEQLARIHPLTLISADSQQVYRGLDIGTCKPPVETRRDWGLVDVVEPGANFSAGEFCRKAAPLCEEAWAKGRIPLLCGGTGLYLKALFEGLVEIPEIPASLRSKLQDDFENLGLEVLFRRLEQGDPVLAAEIDRLNPRRVLRALEVLEGTGKPLSAWRVKNTKSALEEPVRPLWLGLDPGREVLVTRIVERVDACLAQGWLEEVRRLAVVHRDWLRQCPAIGYPELLKALEEGGDGTTAKPSIVARTLQYARRQRTWFRAVPAIRWAHDGAELLGVVDAFIQGRALPGAPKLGETA
jgi:tRNA dimethylallyltransferase